MGTDVGDNAKAVLCFRDEKGIWREIPVDRVEDLSIMPDNCKLAPTINRVIFHGPATIVYWDDGTKTVVKCMEGDKFSYDAGIYAAMLKKLFGSTYAAFKKDARMAIKEAIEKDLTKKKKNYISELKKELAMAKENDNSEVNEDTDISND